MNFTPGHTCQTCAYFELIPLDKGGTRRLCHFNGMKNPTCGMAEGCAYLEGDWVALPAILGLTPCREMGKNGIPNQVRPGNGFFSFPKTERIVAKQQYFAFGDKFIGTKSDKYHIPKKAEPHVREGVNPRWLTWLGSV